MPVGGSRASDGPLGHPGRCVARPSGLPGLGRARHPPSLVHVQEQVGPGHDGPAGGGARCAPVEPLCWAADNCCAATPAVVSGTAVGSGSRPDGPGRRHRPPPQARHVRPRRPRKADDRSDTPARRGVSRGHRPREGAGPARRAEAVSTSWRNPKRVTHPGAVPRNDSSTRRHRWVAVAVADRFRHLPFHHPERHGRRTVAPRFPRGG